MYRDERGDSGSLEKWVVGRLLENLRGSIQGHRHNRWRRGRLGRGRLGGNDPQVKVDDRYRYSESLSDERYAFTQSVQLVNLCGLRERDGVVWAIYVWRRDWDRLMGVVRLVDRRYFG